MERERYGERASLNIYTDIERQIDSDTVRERVT